MMGKCDLTLTFVHLHQLSITIIIIAITAALKRVIGTCQFQLTQQHILITLPNQNLIKCRNSIHHSKCDTPNFKSAHARIA
jgi:hypothetical protein